MQPSDERAMVATFQSLGYLKDGRMVVLRPQGKVIVYRYDPETMEVEPAPPDEDLTLEAIATFQSAGYLLDHGSYKALASAR